MLRSLVLGACLAFAQTSPADTLHAARDGAYWHHDSGWVFPQRIAEFVRVGIPQDVAGSTDIIAYYARDNGSRISASVDVYASDSALNDATLATLATAKKSFARELGAATALSELTLQVGESRKFDATRVQFESAAEGSRTTHVLYFADTGAWLVKVRVTLPSADPAVLQLTDAFVRGLRWESLGQDPH